MSMTDVFAPVQAAYREAVLQSTWGHLAPKRNKSYRGSVVFAVGCFGGDPLNPTILSAEFSGLEDSPWLYEALQELVANHRDYGGTEQYTHEPGGVYRWTGVFRNYRFEGSIERMSLLPQAPPPARG